MEYRRISPLPTIFIRRWSQRRGRTGRVTVRVPFIRILPCRTQSPEESYMR